MGHVDHYDDMSINIDAHLIAAACASTPLVGEYFCALYGKLAELGGLQGKVGSLPYFNLGDNRTGYGAYTITSLNHFIGAYYAADLVPRMNQCEGREAQERLGYRYKWLEGDCGEFSQGDCHNENETMGGLAALTTDSNYSDAVSLGFCPALLNYNGLTCHTHDVHPGDSVSGAEYIPLDNMVEYWMDQWGASTDIVKLAPALHASQDVFVPHHNYLYMGRGHGMFESWSQGRAIESFLCRNGVTDPQHCSPYSFNEFYHPDTIRAFLQRWYPGQEAIGEGLTTDIAEESAWAPLAGMGVPALSLAIRWQAENSTADAHANEYNWWGVAAFGHNRAVASTVGILKNAFGVYIQRMRSAGYCAGLAAEDPAAWLRIIPGPLVGSRLPTLGRGGFFIHPVNGIAETGHPYFNDNDPDSSANEVSFNFPAACEICEIQVNRVALTFNPRSDWHDEEGDYLIVEAYLLDPAMEPMRQWIEVARYDRPAQVPPSLVYSVADSPAKVIEKFRIRLIQGAEGQCTPAADGRFVFGYKINRIDVNYRERRDDPPDGQAQEASEVLQGWMRGLGHYWMDADYLRWIGTIYECVPPSPCWDDLSGSIASTLGSYLDAGAYLRPNDVFDLVHETVAGMLSPEALSPTLTAYAIVSSAMTMSPGESIVNDGIADAAMSWISWRQNQDLNPPKGPTPRVVFEDLHASLDFSGSNNLHRHRSYLDGVEDPLPGVPARNMDGYPSFREPTNEELVSPETYSRYLEAKSADVHAYADRRRTVIAKENVEALLRILETENGTNLHALLVASAEKERLRSALPWMGQSDGAACGDGRECRSEICTQGICCRTQCVGLCQSCVLPGTEGECLPLPDATACADGDLCNGNESCVAGECTAGAPLACDDVNPCTHDRCDPLEGCTFETAPDDTDCGFGPCGPLACRAGVCLEARPDFCDDQNPCTLDSCDPEESCVHEAAADGTTCGVDRVCDEGYCIPVEEDPPDPQPTDSGCGCSVSSGSAGGAVNTLLLFVLAALVFVQRRRYRR